MILIALGLLASLALALGIGGPAGANAVRTGKTDFHGVRVERLASGEVANWFEESWVDSTAGRAPGTVIPWAPRSPGPGLVLERRLESLGGGLWLLEVIGRQADRAGRTVAATRRGWLVRVGVAPGDSFPSGRLLERGAVRGFQ